ncbi:MAG: phosphotransferase [Lentisphaerota bacterium]
MLNYSQYLPQILENYPVVVVQHEHLRTSENVVVKLLSETGQPYALRIRKIMGSYHEQILSELICLRDLREYSGADIPAPIATRSGQLFCVINVEGGAYMCVLFSWVAGVHVSAREITLSQMGAMARAVSLLHNFSSGYRPPAGFVRPVYDEQWFFGSSSWSTSGDFVSRLHPGEAAYLRTVNDAVRERLRAYPRNEASFGLIHYDLHVGNFLFHEDRANMIDFDECGFGYYLFDVAHILFEFIDDSRYNAFRKVVTEQYAAARSVEPVPDGSLDLFLALQGIAYMNWLYRIFWRDGNEGALPYWVPKIVQRINILSGQPHVP